MLMVKLVIVDSDEERDSLETCESRMDGSRNLVLTEHVICNFSDCVLIFKSAEAGDIDRLKGSLETDKVNFALINEVLDGFPDVLLRLFVLVDILDVNYDGIRGLPARREMRALKCGVGERKGKSLSPFGQGRRVRRKLCWGGGRRLMIRRAYPGRTEHSDRRRAVGLKGCFLGTVPDSDRGEASGPRPFFPARI